MGGIIEAIRSVIFTVVLLFLILYVFGIIFKSQVEEDSNIRRLYFHSVPSCMWTLVMHGTFLDSVSTVAGEIKSESTFLTIAFLIFIFVSALTVMNMLIGIV